MQPEHEVSTDLEKPYGKMLQRANDFYHGCTSIRKHGVMEHTKQLAEVFLESGDATDPVEAMYMAIGEVQSIQRIARGMLPNREAHQGLNAKKQASGQGASLRDSATEIRQFIMGGKAVR